MRRVVWSTMRHTETEWLHRTGMPAVILFYTTPLMWLSSLLSISSSPLPGRCASLVTDMFLMRYYLYNVGLHVSFASSLSTLLPSVSNIIPLSVHDWIFFLSAISYINININIRTSTAPWCLTCPTWSRDNGCHGVRLVLTGDKLDKWDETAWDKVGQEMMM